MDLFFQYNYETVFSFTLIAVGVRSTEILYLKVAIPECKNTLISKSCLFKIYLTVVLSQKFYPQADYHLIDIIIINPLDKGGFNHRCFPFAHSFFCLHHQHP